MHGSRVAKPRQAVEVGERTLVRLARCAWFSHPRLLPTSWKRVGEGKGTQRCCVPIEGKGEEWLGG